MANSRASSLHGHYSRMVKKLILAARKGSLPDRRLMPLPAHSTSADHLVVPCNAQFRVPARPSIRQWEQQPVLLALVIALLVVMGHVLLQGSAQRSLPEQDELRQAFLFYRSH